MASSLHAFFDTIPATDKMIVTISGILPRSIYLTKGVPPPFQNKDNSRVFLGQNAGIYWVILTVIGYL